MFNTVWTAEGEAVNFFFSTDMITVGSTVCSAVNFVVWTHGPDLKGGVIFQSLFLVLGSGSVQLAEN